MSLYIILDFVTSWCVKGRRFQTVLHVSNTCLYPRSHYINITDDYLEKSQWEISIHIHGVSLYSLNLEQNHFKAITQCVVKAFNILFLSFNCWFRKPKTIFIQFHCSLLYKKTPKCVKSNINLDKNTNILTCSQPILSLFFYFWIVVWAVNVTVLYCMLRRTQN